MYSLFLYGITGRVQEVLAAVFMEGLLSGNKEKRMMDQTALLSR